MSIKGIDTQIMMSRVVDASRDSASANRRGENTLNHAAVTNREQADHDTRSVIRTEHSDQAEIHRDSGGGGGAYGEDSRKKHSKPEEDELELFAGVKEERKIDIII